MNTRIPFTFAVGALTLALAACNADQTDNNAMGGANDTAAMGDPAAPGAAGTLGNDTMANDPLATDPLARGADTQANMADRVGGNVDRDATLAMVMAVDQHEIAAAEQAQEKQLSGDAAAYAETLLEDHTRNLEATRGLMGLEGEPGTGDENVPGADDDMVAQMREKHASERERLGQLDGDEYERAWIEAMVAGHTEALQMLDNQLIPSADDEELRGHLQNTRQAIARHLETAQELRDNNSGNNNR